ncbi:hypothetical protein ACFYWX_38680 [Streptomyces sp. NPDC002888]|uniref:hypothetical protein n=1 Tax=Streptomyces sp. NPDC002888 TaxID=3364668 RepID=UPI0036945915
MVSKILPVTQRWGVAMVTATKVLATLRHHRHIANKEQLITLMVDAAFAREPAALTEAAEHAAGMPLTADG